MVSEVAHAITAGDAAALARLVGQTPQLANTKVPNGPNCKDPVPPLHFVCDVVFRKAVTQAQGRALAEVLLKAGVDPNLEYAASGDTFVITAASLGAESVGLLLVEAGASVSPVGLFEATALHWSAFMGLPQLALALIQRGADLHRKDAQYQCTPVQWALYGWNGKSNGNRDAIPSVVRHLVAAGASVPDDALDNLEQGSPMRAALLPE